MPKTSKIGLIGKIGLIVGCVFSILLICWGLFLIDSVKNRNVEVCATITDVKQNDLVFLIEYTYEYKKDTYHSSIESQEPFEIGVQHNIFIRKNNPEHIYIKGEDFMIGGFLALVSALGFIIMGTGIISLVIVTIVSIVILKKSKTKQFM